VVIQLATAYLSLKVLVKPYQVKTFRVKTFQVKPHRKKMFAVDWVERVQPFESQQIEFSPHQPYSSP
jgi:hypothetical protein